MEDEEDMFGSGKFEPVDEANSGGHAKARKVDGTAMVGRKKRAFLGRRMHLELVIDEGTGEIVKGTFVALVHEVVFGTTFVVSLMSSVSNAVRDGDKGDQEAGKEEENQQQKTPPPGVGTGHSPY
jgi:GTPase-activating protein BEM2